MACKVWQSLIKATAGKAMFTLLLYNNQRKRLRSSSGPVGCVKSADDWESKAKEKVVAFFTRFPLRFFFCILVMVLLL